MKLSLKQCLPLLVLCAIFAVAIYFQWYHTLSFERLKAHRKLLLVWREQHFLWVMLGFVAIYVLSVSCSIPGAIFLTLTAGFLFGPIWGLVLTVISATLGAFIIFLAVKFAFRDWFIRKANPWIKDMAKGFRENAFSYLLFLRLVPLFPFWLVNIVPALLGVSSRTFALATFMGIIPASFIYVMVGNSLGHVFDAKQTPNLQIIFDPPVLLPLLGLAFLALLPAIYKWVKKFFHATPL